MPFSMKIWMKMRYLPAEDRTNWTEFECPGGRRKPMKGWKWANDAGILEL